MFQSGELKAYHFYEQGRFLGEIKVNQVFDFQKTTTRPFIRNGKRTLEMIGKVNYLVLDQFIITSLNDYYKKLSEKADYEVLVQRNQEYQALYALWQKILVAKQNNDFALNAYYDDLIYRLYINGYRN